MTVGTRGSRMSRIQTDMIVQKLKELLPDADIEIKVIRTIGDLITQKPLFMFERKGIFEREIDRAVTRGEVDFAVHSLKDVPTTIPQKTVIVAVPERGSPHDVLVSRDGLGLKDLPEGAVIGTSSPRRMAQTRYVRPDLKVRPIRGNVDTRVKKLERGWYDALILAEAGLRRLGLQDRITERLSLEDFTPAPGQGALAVIANKDNKGVVDILKQLNHQPSMAAALAERAFIRAVGGGCKVPLGALAQSKGDKLSLFASVLSPDGSARVQASNVGDLSSPEDLGLKVAQEVLKLGGGELVQRGKRV
ncbi:MAG: hydroxymethylbilane synthase [Candidatus Bathyarchaeia archaeon]